jgi:hypothetical protein
MISTARDMYAAVLHLVQKEDAEGVPVEKFNFWINKGYEDWLSERSRQFDLDQKRIDDLYVLRTTRTININGVRTVLANTSLELDENGDGTIEIISQSYFELEEYSFYGSGSNTGTIDLNTGEVAGAISGDIFWILIKYMELDYQILSLLTIGETALGTHTGTLTSTRSDYYTFIEEVAEIGDPWTDLIDGDDPITFHQWTDYRFLIPNGTLHPKYFKLLGVRAKLTYVENALFGNGPSGWLKANVMRADQRTELYNNAYRYPTDEKIYYYQEGEFIILVNETDSTPLQLEVTYLRYPLEIEFVPNGTSVNCELPPIQQKEIVERTARLIIEASQGQRYQTVLMEDQMNKQFQ